MQDDAAAVSEFRVEKYRAEAVLTLSSGRTVAGCFFVANGSARHAGRERVGDLLNSEAGFFPFEIRTDGQVETVLFHRAHIVMVVLSENEARRDPGPVSEEQEIYADYDSYHQHHIECDRCPCAHVSPQFHI